MGEPYFAQDRSEMLSPEQIMGMSGLDFIRGMVEGRLPAPPICRAMNYTVFSADEGRVVFRGTPEFEHMNPIGSVHGGWFGTLLDSCMACAVQTKLPQGTAYTTLEYRVNIIRGIVPDGRQYDAIGDVDHVGRRTAVAHGALRGVEDGKLYATGSTTCLLMSGG